MNIKTLQKAKQQLDRLQDLDKEIINIERLAMKLKDGKDNITLSLGCDKPQEPIKVPDETQFYTIPSFPFSYLRSNRKCEVNSKDTSSFEITDVMALQVLGVIVAHKENERMSIINQLNTLGVEVNS